MPLMALCRPRAANVQALASCWMLKSQLLDIVSPHQPPIRTLPTPSHCLRLVQSRYCSAAFHVSRADGIEDRLAAVNESLAGSFKAWGCVEHWGQACYYPLKIIEYSVTIQNSEWNNLCLRAYRMYLYITH